MMGLCLPRIWCGLVHPFPKGWGYNFVPMKTDQENLLN